MVDDLSKEMNEAVFIAMNQTIDGYIPASFRRGADVQTDDREKFQVGPELRHFQALVHDTAASEVRAGLGDGLTRGIPSLVGESRKRVLEQLFDAREHALSYAWSEGSKAGRELAVRYWRIFCAYLGLPEVIRSHREAWQLQYFAAFMGLVWKKTNGDVGLAGTTVEQQVSRVRVWLSEEFGIRVLAFDSLTSKVVKGIKKQSKVGLGVMYTVEVTYRFQQRWWESDGSYMSLLFQDMSSMRFLMLRRISEVASTKSHDNYYLLHFNCTLEGDVKFWAFWPLTKNSKNLARSTDGACYGLFRRLRRRYHANEQWLKAHPQFDREKLPFFHIDGRPVHRREVEREAKRLMALAFTLEPGVGHLNPALYRYSTHSDRKGGAIWMLDTVLGIEFYVRFMGDWKSLAFYVYGRVSRKSAALVERTLGQALARLFEN